MDIKEAGLISTNPSLEPEDVRERVENHVWQIHMAQEIAQNALRQSGQILEALNDIKKIVAEIQKCLQFQERILGGISSWQVQHEKNHEAADKACLAEKLRLEERVREWRKSDEPKGFWAKCGEDARKYLVPSTLALILLALWELAKMKMSKP